MRKESKETESRLVTLSENGKYEVKELHLKLGDKEYNAIVRVDFALFKKAYAVMLDTKFTGQGKEDAGVEIQMDLLGAGDKILFFGWLEGDEAIKEKMRLRVMATQELGEWFTELIGDNEADEGEKKS